MYIYIQTSLCSILTICVSMSVSVSMPVSVPVSVSVSMSALRVCVCARADVFLHFCRSPSRPYALFRLPTIYIYIHT